MAHRKYRNRLLTRRAFMASAAATAGLPLATPWIVKARGETPIKVGVLETITGTNGAFGRNEVAGFELARDEINAKGGILGRPIELLVEDAANDVGTGVQKTEKLVSRDKVDLMVGDVNSAVALAAMQVSNRNGILHFVCGAHSDPISGKDCKWNVFHVCNTTTMEANAIADVIAKKFGTKWYFITPDYTFGHALQKGFEARLKKFNGTVLGSDLVPIGTPEYSAYLIKARAAAPDVLIVLLSGQDMVNCMKQAVQFGLEKKFAIAGGQQELENLLAMPPEARIGWWCFEWYWKVPGIEGLDEFVEKVKKRTGHVPTAHHWFAYAGLYTYALNANQQKTTDAVRLAKAIEGYTLPPEIALQPHPLSYRAGDHQLMTQLYIGTAKRGDENPEDLFEVSETVLGDQVAAPLGETGCKMAFPT
jgi:branched-chain amino acid transport system substrate-binding protein